MMRQSRRIFVGRWHGRPTIEWGRGAKAVKPECPHCFSNVMKWMHGIGGRQRGPCVDTCEPGIASPFIRIGTASSYVVVRASRPPHFCTKLMYIGLGIASLVYSLSMGVLPLYEACFCISIFSILKLLYQYLFLIYCHVRWPMTSKSGNKGES